MAKGSEIYVKLPTGVWVRIKGKIERIVKVRGKKDKQSISYTLIGESLEDKPSVDRRASKVFYISSGNVTKYLMKILDYNIDKPVIIEPYTLEIYRVKVYDRDIAIKIMKIAEEMKIMRNPRRIEEEPE